MDAILAGVAVLRRKPDRLARARWVVRVAIAALAFQTIFWAEHHSASAANLGETSASLHATMAATPATMAEATGDRDLSLPHSGHEEKQEHFPGHQSCCCGDMLGCSSGCSLRCSSISRSTFEDTVLDRGTSAAPVTAEKCLHRSSRYLTEALRARAPPTTS